MTVYHGGFIRETLESMDFPRTASGTSFSVWKHRQCRFFGMGINLKASSPHEEFDKQMPFPRIFSFFV